MPWWGDSVVPHGTCARWRIGPLRLWAQRLPGEWRIAREASDESTSATIERGVRAKVDDLLGHDSLGRFAMGGEDESLTLTPRLADRPVVSTPRRPFYIPSGEEVTVHIGTPLWIELRAGERQTWLDEFPIHQPSDTWFGPNTRTGELCYASRTFCRLQLGELQRRPQRATTAVLIQNHTDSPLYLDRFKLPVPFLSLYCDDGTSNLWTNDVVLERVEGEELDPLRVSEVPPASLANATRISEPRRKHGGNLMVRAFGALFSDGEANP